MLGDFMKRFVMAAVAVFCFASPAVAQSNFTADAIMITFATMNQPPPTPDADTGDYSNFHKVAVLCALNEVVPFYGRGDDGMIDISSWRINAQMCDLLRKRLAGRFEFVDFAVDPVALARHVSRQGTTEAFLKTLTNPGVDAYIVVRPVDGSYTEPGVALRTNATEGEASLFVDYEIDIIDAHKLTVVGSADGCFRTREPQHAFYPVTILKNIDKAALIAGKDPEALERVHRALDWSLELSTVETLRALETGAVLPPVGDHSIATPQFAATMAKYNNVEVISDLGKDLRFTVGGHLFVHKENVVLPGVLPEVDQQIESVASAVLAHHHTVKPTEVDRALLANAAISVSGKVEDIAGLHSSNDVDAYVLILKASFGSDDTQQQGGITATHWIPATDNTLTVYANAGIAVVDAHTLEVVDTTTLSAGPKDICDHPTMVFIAPGPNCLIDEKKYAPETPAALSEAAKTEIRATTQKILADAVPETLFAMGLDWPAEIGSSSTVPGAIKAEQAGPSPADTATVPPAAGPTTAPN
jgi:hypothetical protein